jgi:pentose-5-phosphate-3-epimerase
LYDKKIQQWIEDMAAAGAQQYTFHAEATEDIMNCINKVRSANMKVIFKPALVFSLLFSVLSEVS